MSVRAAGTKEKKRKRLGVTRQGRVALAAAYRAGRAVSTQGRSSLMWGTAAMAGYGQERTAKR